MTKQTSRRPDATSFERIERKYALPDFMLEETVAAVQQNLPVYRYGLASDWSSIRTTYLDTLELQFYQEYLARRPVRKKLRIRQYGKNGSFDDTFWVELKVKNRRVSIKRRFRCGREELSMLMQGADARDRVQALNNTPVLGIYDTIFAMIHEEQLIPSVQIEYARIAFQEERGSGRRITLDRDLRVRDPQQRQEAHLPGLVLEIKYKDAMPEWMPRLREGLGLKRAKRFSKYARSIRSLHSWQEGESSRWAG